MQASLVPCPYCGRSFSETAAERHIPKCQDIIHKPSRLMAGSGTGAHLESAEVQALNFAQPYSRPHEPLQGCSMFVAKVPSEDFYGTHSNSGVCLAKSNAVNSAHTITSVVPRQLQL